MHKKFVFPEICSWPYRQTWSSQYFAARTVGKVINRFLLCVVVVKLEVPHYTVLCWTCRKMNRAGRLIGGEREVTYRVKKVVTGLVVKHGAGPGHLTNHCTTPAQIQSVAHSAVFRAAHVSVINCFTYLMIIIIVCIFLTLLVGCQELP